MKYDRVSKAILRKLFYDNRIGAKHLGINDITKGFPSHIKGDVEKQIRKLVKKNLILHHPTSYGMQYSLNPRMIQEIVSIIEQKK